jgi:hypothetical protein
MVKVDLKMDKYEEFQVAKKSDAGLIEKNVNAKKKIYETKKSMKNMREEVGYAKTAFIRGENCYDPCALRRVCQAGRSIESSEMARKKRIILLLDELDELLEFYRSVEKMKNV